MRRSLQIPGEAVVEFPCRGMVDVLPVGPTKMRPASRTDLEWLANHASLAQLPEPTPGWLPKPSRRLLRDWRALPRALRVPCWHRAVPRQCPCTLPSAERLEFLNKLAGFFFLILIVQDVWNEIGGWRLQSNRQLAIDNPFNRQWPINNRQWISCPTACSRRRAA
jgi:hypothetical protein